MRPQTSSTVQCQVPVTRKATAALLALFKFDASHAESLVDLTFSGFNL